MKLHHISIRVKDFEKSLKFYTELAGLVIIKKVLDNVMYLGDSEDNALNELIGIEGQSFEGKGMFICFGTDDLESVHKKAEELGYSPSDIRQPEPTAKYFYVYDPDGVSVQFREYK